MTIHEPPINTLEFNKKQLVNRFLRREEPHFLERHAEILDDYFRESYEISAVGPRMRIDKNPFVFIALGGYGRKEQCLHSDVDILVLFRKKIPTEAKELVHELFYPLWDLGLEVGYAIRTLKECLSLASRDYEVLTSLLDARFICGISSLHIEFMDLLQEKVLYKNRRTLLTWLAQSSRERSKRFGDSTYLLEPNIKEGQGGLRDYHTVLWLSHILHNLREPRDLEFFGFLSHQEFQDLSSALSFIWEVRNWLHSLTSRKADQLYFEYQITLADSLGFRSKNGQQAVELFLGALHGHMEVLKLYHLLFLERTVPENGSKPLRRIKTRTSLSDLEIDQSYLNFPSPEAILDDPYLLIQIFEQSSQKKLPLSIEALRLVREFSYLIDDEYRSSPTAIKAFQRILLSRPQKFNVLNEMLNTGILVSLIPELKGIVNRVQYDRYHLYPVDKHSLRTVQILKSFAEPEGEPGRQLYRDLFEEIKRPHLLLWAGLLHDIGKGVEGEDHAKQGAQIAQTIFERMNFHRDHINTICFLIQEHLLLFKTSSLYDINDEKNVVQCARKIQNINMLKMLYLLTVADSMATGPKAWNDWTDHLLKELFFKLLRILETGELATKRAAKTVEKKRKDILKNCTSMPLQEVEGLFDQMSPRYLLYTPSKDILEHIQLYQDLGDEPFVWKVKRHGAAQYRTVAICAKDRPGLFSKISGTFTLRSMDILSAQIYTWRNHIALDIFEVKAPPDILLEDEVWAKAQRDLKSALAGNLDLDAALHEKFVSYLYPLDKSPIQPSQVIVDNRSSNFFTIVEIYTHDFPGLLYKITNALFRCRLDVWVAKIATKIDQVVDVFYVRDFDGQKADGQDQEQAIKEAIEPLLDHKQGA